MKFYKKSNEVEALQWTGSNIDMMKEFVEGPVFKVDTTSLSVSDKSHNWIMNIHDWLVKIDHHFVIYNHNDFVKLYVNKDNREDLDDGYHTFKELYEYRKLYNAAFFNSLPKDIVLKSKRHSDGEKCFDGNWFIVQAELPNGQISNHYEMKDWDLFKIPEKEIANEWDGHSPEDVAKRIEEFIKKY